MRARVRLVVGALLAGCGHARTAGVEPVSAPQSALVRSLASGDAHPQGCGQARAQELEPLLDALAAGSVPQPTAAACVVTGWLQLPAADGARFAQRFAEVYGRALAAPDRALQRALQTPLLAMPAAELARLDRHPLEQRARDGLAAPGLLAEAHALAAELLDALELAQGRYRGEPLTVERLAVLDEPPLELCVRRLADARLVRAAQRELLVRRARRSELAEVRDHVDEVAEAVLARGANVVDLQAHPVRALRAEPVRQPWILRQEPELQRASLVSYIAPDGSPGLSLRNVLWAQLEGLSRPVTLCAGPAELDPAPCVSPDAVRGELARVPVAGGSLQLGAAFSTSELLPLMAATPELRVPVRLEQQTVAVVIPVSLVAPEPIVLSAQGRGARGPDVQVALRRQARWIVAEVRSQERALMPVLLEPAQLDRFAIVSRGADGAPGAAGRAGMLAAGAALRADCASAGMGQAPVGAAGEPGEAGGRGGDGGDLQVELACEADGCNALASFVRERVRSEPGKGGPGGAGGPGAAANRGASCVSIQNGQISERPAWQSGAGPAGVPGPAGAAGADGRPGVVAVRTRSPR